MSKTSILFILVSLVILSGCKKDILSFHFTEKKKLNVYDLDFDYFQARSKIRFNDGEQNFNANAHIRIKRDSIIWVSITPSMGIEAIRAIIRPDSIFIIDRLNKSFLEMDIDSLKEKYNLPVSYDMLQSALLGNLIHPREKEDKVTKSEGFFILKQQNQNLIINNMVNSKTMKVERVSISDEPGKSSLEISYGGFQFINENLLPHENDFQVSYKKNDFSKRTEMSIAYNRVSIDDKKIKFPFSVPDKYVSNE